MRKLPIDPRPSQIPGERPAPASEDELPELDEADDGPLPGMPIGRDPLGNPGPLPEEREREADRD